MKEIHQPLFDEFLIAHGQYVAMFGFLREALLEVIVRPSGGEQAVEQIRAEFASKRLEEEGRRTQLRALSDALINATMDELEERFVISLLCYLLSHGTPFKSQRELDTQVRILRESGYGALFDTPSSYVLEVLDSDKDPAAMRDVITEEIERLSVYLSVVCTAFSDLKVAVYT
jgi:hypothetical protein